MTAKRDRRHRIERLAANSAAGLLAVAAFGSSLRHVQLVAATHGQPGWISWLIAISVELVALVAISELSRARSKSLPVPPAAVLALVAGLAMSAAANAATAHGAGGWPIVVALWPVVAYALVVLIVETRPGRSLAAVAESIAAPHSQPQPAPATAVTAAPLPQPAPQPLRAPQPQTGRPDRSAVLADLVTTATANPHGLPTAAALAESTGYSKRWADSVLAEARKSARTLHVVGET